LPPGSCGDRTSPLNLSLLGQKGKFTNVTDKYKRHFKVESRVAKARRFYHIEYFILPDDEEPKIVDIVLFPTVAKVFLESGAKVQGVWSAIFIAQSVFHGPEVYTALEFARSAGSWGHPRLPE
jgi:hypothetical protein